MTDAKPTLFLSYARDDDHKDYDDASKSFMRRLYTDLTNHGFEVWWDRENMPSRSLTFLKEIEQAINHQDRLILVVGPHALTSPYVHAEWTHAYNTCKLITPILRKGDFDSIPVELNQFHTPDFRDESHYQDRLAELLKILTPAGPLAQPYKVPVLPNWYVDRQQDIDKGIKHIRAHLSDPEDLRGDQHLVTLYGMSGAGKSTVAAALAQDCRSRRTYADGIFWLDIGKEPKEEDLALHMSDIGAALGDSRDEYPTLERARLRLSEVLSKKAALIVLDDIWEPSVVEAFRISGNQCCLLVTTRKEELAQSLGGAVQFMNVLSDAESIELLRKRMDKNIAEDDPYLKSIVNYLQNHTLALTLAAAKLSGKNENYLKRYVSRLEHRAETSDPFRDLNLSEEDRNRNLSVSLSLSYEELSEDLQARFRMLGVFPASARMSIEAVQAVWGEDDYFDTESDLEALEAESLLTQDEDGDGFYRIHNLVRAHAGALLRREGDYERYRSRYYTHLLTAESSKDPEAARIRFESIGHLLARFDEMNQVNDVATAQTAWHAIVTHITDKLTDADDDLKAHFDDHEAVAQAQISLARYASERGMFAFLNRHAWIALALTDAADIHFDAYILLGLSLSKLGQLEAATAAIKQAQQLAETAGKVTEAIETSNYLGAVIAQSGNMAEAAKHFNTVLELARAHGNRELQAKVVMNLGNVAYFSSDIDGALEHYKEAAALYESVNDLLGSANLTANIGLLLRSQGKFVEAQAKYQQALDQAMEIDHQQLQGLALNNLIDVTRAMGDLESAAIYARQAHELGKKTASIIDDSRAELGLGVLALYRGDVVSATIHLEKSHEMMKQMEFPEDHGAVLTFLGRVWYQRGQMDKALTLWDEAIQFWEAFTTGGLDAQTSMLTAYKSLVHHQKGDRAEAERLLNTVLDFVDQHGVNGVDEPGMVYVIAHDIFKESDPDRAATLLKTGYDLLQQLAEQFTTDEQRERFFQNVPGNRELLARHAQV